MNVIEVAFVTDQVSAAETAAKLLTHRAFVKKSPATDILKNITCSCRFTLTV